MLRQVALDRRSGVMHLTNQSAVSWYEFVREIVRLVGPRSRRHGAPDLDGRPPAAPAGTTPRQHVLDNAVARMTGMAPMRDFRDPLAELVRVLTA
ncbi:MAG: sugar nucleotide-binding protein [Ilumatobacteraceae bacterium]